MANRNSGGRARSRKRRPAGRTARPGPIEGEAGPARPKRADGGGAAEPGREAPRGGGFRDPQSLGERPQAPWHPLPLSELLILVGAIGVLVGLLRGEHGGPPLFAGLGAVMIGTFEVTLREHRSGYRSHTVLLAAIPAIALHSVVVLAVTAFTRVPRALNLGLLVVDVAVFALLYRVLRAGFRDARRERAFASRR